MSECRARRHTGWKTSSSDSPLCSDVLLDSPPSSVPSINLTGLLRPSPPEYRTPSINLIGLLGCSSPPPPESTQAGSQANNLRRTQQQQPAREADCLHRRSCQADRCRRASRG